METTPGIAREGFDLDLVHGQAREKAFARMLLEGQSTRVLIEHKCDGKAKGTGNVFIEFKQRGRPSGIATTESDFYAIEIGLHKWIVLATSELKAIARRVLKERGSVHGGDFKRYEGVLIPLSEILK